MSILNFESKDEKKINFVVSLLIVVFSSFLIAFSTAAFLQPLALYAGGVTGIAQICLYTFGIVFKNDMMAFSSFLSVLNFLFLLPFNLLAFFKLSKKYALYTFLSSIVQTIVLLFSNNFQSIGIFYNQVTNEYDILSCVLIASLLNGFANGILMRRGATSGGIITLCQYLNLKKGKSVGNVNLLVSTGIMLVGATVSFFGTINNGGNAFGSALTTSLYTLVFFVLSSIVLDYIHTSYNKVKIEIITENGNDVINTLLKELPHGLTIEKGVGGYTKREKDILQVIIQKFEYNYYIQVIHRVDPNAFISVVPIWKFAGNFRTKIIDK